MQLAAQSIPIAELDNIENSIQNQVEGDLTLI